MEKERGVAETEARNAMAKSRERERGERGLEWNIWSLEHWSMNEGRVFPGPGFLNQVYGG